ncbi:potassium channel family protein [Cellulomonas sp. KH9]|uniref:potassium channel family protein n=1 Tax=Cellulomonas sp. KH9 TaxID=1855324 RepID=UPI0008E808AE|nr:potassium channel family protein [Cellulomonas sp. KH9]SFJ98730.1 Ion channel [Cellulomonas sp. KH9]
MTPHAATPEPHGRPREALQFVWRTSLTVVLLTVCYYVLPPAGPFHDPLTGARWLGSVVALCGFVLLVRRSVRTARRDPSFVARGEAVLTVLYVLVLFFAVTYSTMATHVPGQFDGIEDSTDALYFTVTVVSTVGFGDITPVGTAARLVVTTHMLVNLIYVGTALRVLTARGTGRGPEDVTAPARPAP